MAKHHKETVGRVDDTATFLATRVNNNVTHLLRSHWHIALLEQSLAHGAAGAVTGS